jgi:Flp pilus assembly pilin Flp
MKTRWNRSEEGQATVEYAAMLTLMLVLLFIMQAVGHEANLLFNWVASILQ